MASGVKELAGRVRRRARRMVDEQALRHFELDLPAGPTLVLLADPEARSVLPAPVRDLTSGESRGVLTLRELDADAAPVRWGGPWASVLLVASDRADLRRLVPVLPRVGRTESIAVLLADSVAPLSLRPRGEWPVLRAQASRAFHDGGHALHLRFDAPAPVRAVLTAVALQCAPVPVAHPGLFVAELGRGPEWGLDAGSRVHADAADVLEHDMTVPADVLLVPPHLDTDELRDAVAVGHHVIGRPPVLVSDVALQPVDEGVFNPVGFDQRPAGGTVGLAEVLQRSGRVTEQVVRRARGHRAVRVDLAAADVQDVLRLAAAGVPLEPVGAVPGVVPGIAERVRGELAGASALDLADPLARQEYSLRLRRATFDEHSTLAHRTRLAGIGAVGRVHQGNAGLPPVSVVVATRREHELANVAANIRKQVGAEIELVVAGHGFTPDEAALRAGCGDEVGLVVLGFDAGTRFGDVLTAAAQAASHDVVMKMDDDDWYSPHAVHDLLMARRYSGADLVGMPTEFVHLAVFDQTVWRREPSEAFNDHVAGGTMMLSRDLLREVGWFRPVLRWVDAQLLRSVAAVGGTTYRTHGLGYVLVRNEEGHTWAMDPEEFRTADAVERLFDGFHTPGLDPVRDVDLEGVR